MVRVVKPGGYVGIHDICWKEITPESLKRRLAEIEGEKPETLAGWKGLFEQTGIIDLMAVDQSDLIPTWTKGIKKQLGLGGQVKIFLRVIRKWGIKGLQDTWQSQQIFQSKHTGLALSLGENHSLAGKEVKPWPR
jgi:hypothetical protein